MKGCLRENCLLNLKTKRLKKGEILKKDNLKDNLIYREHQVLQVTKQKKVKNQRKITRFLMNKIDRVLKREDHNCLS